MSKRSRSSRVSNPITCWSVTHWASTPHGMPCPQAKKTSGTFRPLERGFKIAEAQEYLHALRRAKHIDVFAPALVRRYGNTVVGLLQPVDEAELRAQREV